MHGSQRGFIGYFPLELFFKWSLPVLFRKKILTGTTLRFSKSKPRVKLAIDILRQVLPRANGTRDKESQSSMILIEGAMLLLAEEYVSLEQEWKATGKANINFEKVVEMLEFMVLHYDQNISSQEIAQHVGLNPNYARNCFKNAMKFTMTDFLSRFRIAYAKDLLVRSHLTTIEVDLDSGFSSTSQFYSTFSRLVGQSPNAFRKQHRGKSAKSESH